MKKINELKLGKKIELEHVPTIKAISKYYSKNKKMPSTSFIATRIAKDHLKEDASYYTKLRRCNL